MCILGNVCSHWSLQFWWRAGWNQGCSVTPVGVGTGQSKAAATAPWAFWKSCPFQHEEKLGTWCRMARKWCLQQGICGCQRRALGEGFSLGKVGSGDNPGLQTCPPHFAGVWHAEQPLANSWGHWEAAWRLAGLSRLPSLSLCYIPSSPWPLSSWLVGC